MKDLHDETVYITVPPLPFALTVINVTGACDTYVHNKYN